MALETPGEEQDASFAILELVLQGIYTAEMVLKIVAFGLIYEEHSYLRDNWNVMDALIVASSWVSMVFSGA